MVVGGVVDYCRYGDVERGVVTDYMWCGKGVGDVTGCRWFSEWL